MIVIGGLGYVDDDSLELFDDGSVHDATLAADTTVAGVPCAGGRSVVFYPSGALKIAYLSRVARLDGVPCAANMIVYFHDNGWLWNAQLAREHEAASGRHPAGVRLTFDEDGTLLEYERRLERDEVVGGIPCSAAYSVWHYANGQPSRLVLAESHSIGITGHARGTELVLDEDGDVEACYPGRTIVEGARNARSTNGAFELPFE